MTKRSRLYQAILNFTSLLYDCERETIDIEIHYGQNGYDIIKIVHDDDDETVLGAATFQANHNSDILAMVSLGQTCLFRLNYIGMSFDEIKSSIRSRIGNTTTPEELKSELDSYETWVQFNENIDDWETDLNKPKFLEARKELEEAIDSILNQREADSV